VNWPHIFLIILIGYLPFMVVSFWVYDMEKISNKIAALVAIFGVDIGALTLFIMIFRWI